MARKQHSTEPDVKNEAPPASTAAGSPSTPPVEDAPLASLTPETPVESQETPPEEGTTTPPAETPVILQETPAASPTVDPVAPAANVEAPAVLGAATGTTVLIANQHTGMILLTTKAAMGILAKPIELYPGTVTPIDAVEWAERKKLPVIQYYIDHGLLAEVNSVRPVPVLEDTSTNLPIPEHLQTIEEQSGQHVAANLRRTKMGGMAVE